MQKLFRKYFLNNLIQKYKDWYPKRRLTYIPRIFVYLYKNPQSSDKNATK